jgi:hypothetical protein
VTGDGDATALGSYIVLPGTITPGGKPVIDVPGLTPMSPEMTVAPVLVTVLAANTAKTPAVPKGIGGWAAAAGLRATPAKITMVAIPTASAIKDRRRREPV